MRFVCEGRREGEKWVYIGIEGNGFGMNVLIVVQ